MSGGAEGGRPKAEGVPEGWREVKLGEVIKIASGQVSPLVEPYVSQFHIGPENVSSGTGELTDLKTAKQLGLISGKYQFDSHSVVYSKIRPNLNKVCVPSFPGICSADMYPIWPIEDILEKGFLFQYMLSPNFYEPMTAASGRTGLPKVNRQELEGHVLRLPPLPEQLKIAAILSTWDDSLATLAKLLTAKQQQKRGLAEALLTGKRRLKGFEGEWEEKKLGEIAEFLNRGKAPTYTEEATSIFAVNQKCVRDGKVNLEFARRHDKNKKIPDNIILRDGDICINSTGTGR